MVRAVLSDHPKRYYVVGSARMLSLMARLPAGPRDRVVSRSPGLPPWPQPPDGTPGGLGAG